MGGACAKCSDVEKGKQANGPLADPGDLEGLEGSEDEHEDDGSEVVASSDGELDPNEYKQDVEDTLKSTGENLKRGKTMAMKEAISTAKKIGLEGAVISNAEKQLDDHKKKQRREATEEEVRQFFESKAVSEIPQAEKMLKKARDAECSPEVIEKMETHLDLLIITRPLEPDECDVAREYMKLSCNDFVVTATKGGGRPVVFLDLGNGKKISATMSLDAPLQNLIMTLEEKEDEPMTTPVMSLRAMPAVKDSVVRNSKYWSKLDEGDTEGAVALRHELAEKPGVWCLLEPTTIRRDRLVEALVVLGEACRP